MFKYLIIAKYSTYKEVLYFEKEIISVLEPKYIKAWVIGKIYLMAQNKNINDRFVKILDLEIKAI